ncbi:MAG TPA: PIN domain nuclease [Thermoanaerobaculia bacterium]|nr:PIN domain nuclease [Thermoanaerobaculia bacterium]
MILVDTSVWIDYLKGKTTEAATEFLRLLDAGQPFGITSVIYQELLQGADSDTSFARLDKYLRTQRFFHLLDPLTSYREAARLYYRCRRVGITLRSTIDCLIAQTAIEHSLVLLHNDRDFDAIAKVAPELTLY